MVFSGKPVLHLQRTTVQFTGSTQSLTSRISTGQLYSTHAAEDKKEEVLHSIISSTEAVQGKPRDLALLGPVHHLNSCSSWLSPDVAGPLWWTPREAANGHWMTHLVVITDVGQEGSFQAQGLSSRPQGSTSGFWWKHGQNCWCWQVRLSYNFAFWIIY